MQLNKMLAALRATALDKISIILIHNYYIII